MQLGVKWSWSGSLYHSEGMMINADYIWHFTEIHAFSGKLPIYVGVGSQMKFDEDGDKNWFGTRVPVGIIYQFEGIPVDIFFEVVPIYEFSSSNDFIVDAEISSKHMIRITNDYILSFFNKYLKSKHSYLFNRTSSSYVEGDYNIHNL
ncbi:MAG: hypothetical protein GY936_02270 [Ignavibacteriae bacterium]|nr:hypothetical protein [Ignavibacteriota bacterium]